MKTLLILRHAKSSWDNARLADHDRPLNKRGKEDAPRMGRLIRKEELIPDLIITSTAERALATAEAAAEASGYEGEIRRTRELYLAGPETYLAVLRKLPAGAQRVMVVGHNPGMEELVELLIGRPERMPTAALAQVELPVGQWGELDEETKGRLLNLWWPKELSVRD
ncbi:MAG: histidine phosphatase family protein [Chloroflexi bacterium]|nr:histidine phosphatase family protein [Chloroflexota bacterium]MCI0577904.1 histidine phosphatase family protein [Chloroflexota bacterium]MCI0643511.1 histidine phosphatase family protein [Chloroflexota bacterium]MCI0726619.1 histidine phosphatase family protein [Chloroflexota bacterium]